MMNHYRILLILLMSMTQRRQLPSGNSLVLSDLTFVPLALSVAAAQAAEPADVTLPTVVIQADSANSGGAPAVGVRN
ncbi:hypothetical protein, partial [Listeria seeligeri]|uniref:hypothetical protein n=1 Tax=Listeria seeligeri TaxID=1640 RepID=UPI0022EBE5E7